MADFRRYFYALALVALFAGLTVSASAQTFQCSNTTGVPPTVRAEGYSELVGDLIIDCTGGVPTTPGQQVQQVNIAINLDTFVSSKVTAVVNGNTEFLESLIIIDEPSSPQNPATPIRNCGFNSEDSTAAGPGVCNMVGAVAANASIQYNGSSAGHANVFQGRSLQLINGQTNQVLFLAVPIDPPGTLCAATIGSGTILAPQNPTALCHRIIRITNIRGDASQTGVAQGNQTSSITAQIISNPVSGLPVDNPTHVVARVQLGLVSSGLTNNTTAGGKFDFIQCNLLFDTPSLTGGNQNQGLVFTFREAFANAFKPRSLRQTLNNGTTGPYSYTGGIAPNTSSTVSLNQNVVGTTYDTESGYENGTLSTGNPPTNPLSAGAGIGNPFTDTTNAPNSTTATDPNTGLPIGTGTGITNAGIATQGTRLMLTFGNVPTGSTIAVPTVVQLFNVATVGALVNPPTGVAVLVPGTSKAGSGYPITGIPTTSPAVAFNNPPAAQTLITAVPGQAGTGITLVAGSSIPGSVLPLPGFAVYEIFFANPGAVEQLSIPMAILNTCSLGTAPTAPCPNLPGNVPAAGTTATVTGGFAPFYAPAVNVRTAAIEGSGSFGENLISVPAKLPVPRFQNLNGPIPLFSITRCSCNLLFPFVTNAATTGGNFDTGIAIDNTSLDPGATFGFGAGAQSGPVELWYYNRSAATAAEPNFLGNQGNTQCTNTTTPGSCTGTLATVPAGGLLLYVLSSGGSIGGASALVGAPGFTGYVIAQSGFQYCHGFAYISKQGGGFQVDNMAMGYLALEIDKGGLVRTKSTSEVAAH